MSVTVAANGNIELQGACAVEDAEVLLQYLLAVPKAPVDWSACVSAHTAVIQILLIARVVPRGTPASRLLAEKIAPLLARAA